MENEAKKYTRCNQLRYGSNDEHTASGNISLYDSQWDINPKCYEICESEKKPNESNILQEKSEKEYHRKMENHPNKSLKSIRNIKIAKAISIESRLCGDDDRIGSSICYWCI